MKVLGILAVLFGATMATAAPQVEKAVLHHDLGLGWTCAMSFSGQAQGAQFFIGYFKTEAVGVMSCGDIHGNRQERNIRVRMQSKILAPSIGIGYFEFSGLSAQVSLLNANPDVLFGDYLVAQGQAAIIGGASVMTALKVGAPQLSLQISLQANHGLGAQLGVQRMSIQPL